MRVSLQRLKAAQLAAYLLPLSSDALVARVPFKSPSDCVRRRGLVVMAARENTSLVWYKASDLRVTDHEPLVKAHRESTKVLHVFCIDPRWFGVTKCTTGQMLVVVHAARDYVTGVEGPSPIQGGERVVVRGTKRMSSGRCRFLLESVGDLQGRLREGGSDLVVLKGRPEKLLPDLLANAGGSAIYTHADVCSEEVDVHEAVRRAVQEAAGEGGDVQGSSVVKSFWGNTVHGVSDLPFTFPGGVPEVYTQFRKSVEQRCKEQPPLPPPDQFRQLPSCDGIPTFTVVPTTEELGLDAPPDRSAKSVLPFEGGETAGLRRIHDYIFDEDRLRTYKETRNGLLGSGFSSKFSPWLALGCVSPRTIVSEVRRYESTRVANQSTYWLVFELLWRDFFHYSAVKNGNSIFHLGGPRHDAGRQQWSDDRGLLEAWKEGMTGYPFIDANMRELKATGFMSNRGRQVVASFFTKDMAMDWRLGAEHFEECLLDHDPASNWGNWNYVAGVGSDPREDRYFNIEKQAKTYDAEAEYMRHWLPELAVLPTTALQTPRGITTMLRHMHAIPTSVYPDPVAALKFSGPGKKERGGQGRGGGCGRNNKRGGQGSRGGRSKTFKSSRIQHDGMP